MLSILNIPGAVHSTAYCFSVYYIPTNPNTVFIHMHKKVPYIENKIKLKNG